MPLGYERANNQVYALQFTCTSFPVNLTKNHNSGTLDLVLCKTTCATLIAIIRCSSLRYSCAWILWSSMVSTSRGQFRKSKLRQKNICSLFSYIGDPVWSHINSRPTMAGFHSHNFHFDCHCLNTTMWLRDYVSYKAKARLMFVRVFLEKQSGGASFIHC